MKKIIHTIALASTIIFTTTSCERYLDITPTGVVIPSTEEDFRALLTKAYAIYPQHKARVDFRTDEVWLNTNSELASYVKDIYVWNDANPDPSAEQYHYSEFYTSIFYSNYIIENAPTTLTNGDNKNQILGEAYALRALNYFELANLYSEVYTGKNGSAESVPLVVTPNLEGAFSKSTLEQVYHQIFSDIEKAEILLNVNSFDAGYNYRFTTTALNALKARIYQYKGDWENALASVNKVLEKKNSLENFNQFELLPIHFKSVESIMNLDLNVTSNLENLSRASEELIALYDKTNDLRFNKYFIANGSKYKTLKYHRENIQKCTFRVGEIMLIKAEALAHLGKESESKKVLLTLAQNRYNTQGLADFTTKINSLNGNAYLVELLNERFRETCYEGLRWFDLRRTGKPSINRTLDGKTYQLMKDDVRYILQYPKTVRLRNPEL